MFMCMLERPTGTSQKIDVIIHFSGEDTIKDDFSTLYRPHLFMC